MKGSNMDITSEILNYAGANKTFRTNDLFSALSDNYHVTRKGLSWHLRQLIDTQRLFRVGRGQYSLVNKQHYCPLPSKGAIRLYKRLVKQYPLLTFCTYNGEILSSLQHHLSYNNNIYVETDREATEAVFHSLQDEGANAYLTPSADMMSDYVHLDHEAIIVKPMVTGSPLQTSSGVTIPRLEKLLVDIHCDKDFFYLQGQEESYILDNAFSLYNVNVDQLLRYAGRRNQRRKFEDYLTNRKELQET